jgi:hypothetical protein
MATTSFLKLPLLGINLSEREPGGRLGAHKIGSKRAQASGPERSGGDNGDDRFDRRGYLDLSTISDDEVSFAYETFLPQLRPSRLDGWINKGKFCLLAVRGGLTDWPLALFGRMVNGSPADGYAQDFRQLTLQVLYADEPPQTASLKAGVIHPDPFDGRPQSYCLSVQIMATPDELTGFVGSEELFQANGFEPVLKPNYTDIFLRRIPSRERPWVVVIGSHWFDGLPEQVKETVLATVEHMLDKNRIVINYHSPRARERVRSLNEILGFKHGLTKRVLYEPANDKETVTMLSSSLEDMLAKPISAYAG